MKLNYKRTIFVGFAFLLICAFWQAYDSIIPKILTDKFGLSQTVSGVIMALDNVFALFLLPIFGMLSDRTKTKYGKRTPFIVIGTVLAIIFLVGLSVPDAMQRSNIDDIIGAEGEAYTDSLDVLWSENPEILVDGAKVRLQDAINEADFKAIPAEGETEAEKDAFTKFVTPARQAYAAAKTRENPGAIIFLIVILFVLLVAMGTFRSPAVALMPDVTLRPLRSKGNAIINLMGTAGGILVLVMGIIFGTGKVANTHMSYTVFFSVVAGLMLVSLVVFLWKVREPKWAAEMEAESRALGLEKEETEESAGENTRKLTRGELISLILLLSSVVFWFMGYNAVTTKYSVYAGAVLQMDYNTTLLIAQAAAIVAYIPVGFISSKIGRKKMILVGVGLLGAAFLFASFLSAGSSVLLMDVLFIMAGIGWASINVNSYPMVVELARGSNVGKYTGYYYTASMAAQVITPVLSGLFMDNISMRALFPYAAIFVAFALCTMLFVKHGDSKPDAGETVLAGIGGGDD